MSVELKNVSFNYQLSTRCMTKALCNISVKIEAGEFVGIMGRTGCGKSTLLLLVAGLQKPDCGRILVDGSDINDRNYDRFELRRTIGVLLQNPEKQLFETTVARDVAFGLKKSGLSEQEIKERVHEALVAVGISDPKVQEQSPFSLSGGQKRLVAIAGVLAMRPHILLLDEPLAGLDPQCRENLLHLLQKLSREGVTILLVSHHADCIAEYAGRVLVLEDGNLVADGSPHEVFGNIEQMQLHRVGTSTSCRIASQLQKRGYPIPANTVRYEELLNAMTKELKGGGLP